MKSMLGAFLLGAFLFFSVLVSWKQAFGADCNKQPIYCHIIRVAPNTPNAMELSNSIARVAKKFQVDPHLVVAIAAQESGLRNRNRVIGSIDANGCRLHVTDWGVLQVNENSVKAYKLDPERISVDLAYQLEAGVMILADKMRVFGDWATYHSNTPRHRENYRKAVSRWL